MERVEEEHEMEKNIKVYKKRRIFILAFVLLFAVYFVLFFSGSIDILKDKIHNLVSDNIQSEWDELVLNEKLPESDANIQYISDNSRNYLSFKVDMGNVQYYEYLDLCKEAGYTVDAYEEDLMYIAFNADGYELCLDKSYSSWLEIELYAPLKMEKIDWESNELCKIIPLPGPDTGLIIENTYRVFEVLVDDITEIEYETYIDKCIEAGFNKNIEEQTEYEREYSYELNRGYLGVYYGYFAENDAGYWICVEYIGDDRIIIEIGQIYEDVVEDDSYADAEPTPIANGARDVEGYEDIKNIQLRLKELGYLDGSADGIFGPGTERALKEFQQMNGIEVTGVADYSTLMALESDNSVSKYEKEVVDAEASTSEELVDGMRPSVKNAIDSFEEYFVEYVELIEKIEKNPNNPLLLIDYAEFLKTYDTTMRAFEDMEDDNLNDAEMAYYLAAFGRVNQMLINVTYEVDY